MPDLEGLVTRVDTRPIQQLHSITTLEDIRTERLLSTLEAASHASKLPDIRTAPEKHATALDAIHQREAKAKQRRSPVALARQQLSADITQRMDATVQNCRIARDNRSYRLNSLGVFEADQNEVRSRSMMRVSLRKELSTASMRLPQPQKEVKLSRPDDSLAVRLERMCGRVMRSIEHDPRAVRGPAAGHPAGGTRRISYAATQNVAGGGDRPGASSDATGDAASETSRSINLTRSHSLVHNTSLPHGRAQGGLAPNPSPSPTQGLSGLHLHAHLAHPPELNPHPRISWSGAAPRSPSPGAVGLRALRRSSGVSSIGTGHGPRSQPAPSTRPPLDWQADLPPEAAAAHMQHLHTVTEQHIARYHDLVVEQQAHTLLAAGIPAEYLDLTPQQLAAQLQRDAAANGPVVVEETAKPLKPVSDCLLHTTSIPQLVAAAVEHCSLMTQELEDFKQTLPKPTMASPRGPVTTGGHRASRRHPASSTAVPRLLVPGPAGAGSFTVASTQDRDVASDAGSEQGGSCQDSQRSAGEAHSSTTQQPGQVQPPRLASQVPADTPGLANPPPAPPRAINLTIITPKRLAEFEQVLQAAGTQSPQLPPLPPLSPAPSASLHVQARLERVWNLLLMPLTARLDMVLAYTARERANQFETALEAWERAAVAVVAREELLAGLTALQLGVEDGSIAHVSVTAVERQCVALAQVTAYVQRCREALVGSELTYEGLPYPGEAVVTQAHMLAFMEWLRDESPPSLRLTT